MDASSARSAGAFDEVRAALVRGNWLEAENTFTAFCAAQGGAIPAWFEDEYIFAAMRLWADGRLAQLLRHFRVFFERATGRELACEPLDPDALRAAEALS
jgi:hypothetical protein